MSNYKFYVDPRSTPISQPIPGRSKEMKENLAGGFAFKAEDFMVLKRWLLTGSMNNAFYQNSAEMTEPNVDILNSCVEKNPEKVAEEIIYASNKGINNHTPILALVYLSMGEFNAKKLFRETFGRVIRTGSHLYEFMSLTKSLRGFGKTIHKAINGWLISRDAKELEYQFLKYQQREGWSARDVLRMIKPKTEDAAKNFVYKWAVGKGTVQDLKEFESIGEDGRMRRIAAYEGLKKGAFSDTEVLTLIDKLKLTHEMIPANIKRTTPIWEALYQKMPVWATIRNLGNLTDKGVFENLSNIDVLEKRLSKERLQRGRVHPLTIASAYEIYQMGTGLRGKLSWKVVPRICDILEEAIEITFDIVEPTGKVFYHALDISTSMTSKCVGNLWMTPMEVEGIMTLASIRSEKNYFVGGFSNDFVPLSYIRGKGCSFADVISGNIFDGLNFGGTNAASAFRYATENKIYADVFVCWTDGESWLGGHPSQALKEYREKVNPKAKAIYVTLVPYGDATSLSDPKDKDSYDIAGFSGDTIKLIQMIAKGDF